MSLRQVFVGPERQCLFRCHPRGLGFLQVYDLFSESLFSASKKCQRQPRGRGAAFLLDLGSFLETNGCPGSSLSGGSLVIFLWAVEKLNLWVWVAWEGVYFPFFKLQELHRPGEDGTIVRVCWGLLWRPSGAWLSWSRSEPLVWGSPFLLLEALPHLLFPLYSTQKTKAFPELANHSVFKALTQITVSGEGPFLLASFWKRLLQTETRYVGGFFTIQHVPFVQEVAEDQLWDPTRLVI